MNGTHATMNADITDAINKSLPAHVGEVLRKRLTLADDLEKKTEEQSSSIKRLERLVANLEDQVRSQREIDSKLKAITEAQAKLDESKINAALIELREKHAAERVSDMRGIVKEVFANSQFKYMRSGMKGHVLPGANGGYPTTHTTNDSEMIATEG